MTIRSHPVGLWIPLITPFLDGEIDETSLRRILQHYSNKDIGGFILGATTGEGHMLGGAEMTLLVETASETLAAAESELPIYLGLSGSDPKNVASQVSRMNTLSLAGYLISGPNYLRPSQKGVQLYFEEIARATDRNILIYNIPYRTGVNIRNDTMLKLAEVENIVGVKDCCGDADQSYELIRSAPPGFSVMTGEDPFFFAAMSHGAPGAIVTGAHVLADSHLAIMQALANCDHCSALEYWNKVVHVPRLLFAEPNPSPLKYWLWRQGLIASTEIRLPFLPIGDGLASEIDRCLAESGYLSEYM